MNDGALALSADLDDALDASDSEANFIDPRTVPVRFSNLKNMARSALHYFDAVQSDREDTIAMRFGRGAHAMIFRQPLVLWEGKTRNGKAWETFRAAHADKEILNRKEWSTCEAIAEAIHTHPLAAPLLFHPDAVHEQQIEWEWLGRKCTSRLDARSPGIVIDLKTTQNADPQKFERDALRRGYHAQLAFYSLAYEHAFGTKPAAYIVAVESKRPYAVTVMHVPSDALEQGERLCRAWFERLMVCEASDAWPAYSESVVTMKIEQSSDITIGGVAVEWDE